MAAALKRTSLKIGMIPADGIGKEVLPVSAERGRRGARRTHRELGSLPGLPAHRRRPRDATHSDILIPTQAAQRVIEALGSAIPKPEFIPLAAGWEEFNKNGKALPDETVR